MPPVTEHLLPYAMGNLLYVEWRFFLLELCSLVLLLPLILPLCLVRGNCSDLNMALLSPTYTEHLCVPGAASATEGTMASLLREKPERRPIVCIVLVFIKIEQNHFARVEGVQKECHW